jgi:hypothetical protein
MEDARFFQKQANRCYQLACASCWRFPCSRLGDSDLH